LPCWGVKSQKQQLALLTLLLLVAVVAAQTVVVVAVQVDTVQAFLVKVLAAAHLLKLRLISILIKHIKLQLVLLVQDLPLLEIQQTEALQHLQLLFLLEVVAAAAMELQPKVLKEAGLAAVIVTLLVVLGQGLQIKVIRQLVLVAVDRVVIAQPTLVVMEFLHLLLVRPLQERAAEVGLETSEELGPPVVGMVVLTQEQELEGQLLQIPAAAAVVVLMEVERVATVEPA
jgi:hypothetical protein